MALLNREVLRWIQSLDLSTSVKNARRDLANGFLVAEILTRYYPTGLSSHSFENGVSSQSKRDNWAQIAKFMTKVGLAPGGVVLERQEIEEIIACKPEAVEKFINRLYATLTGKPVPALLPPNEKKEVPAFAKPTAEWRVWLESNEPAMFLQTDLGAKARHARKSIAEHEKAMQQDRKQHPERYSRASNASALGRSASPSSSAGRRSKSPAHHRDGGADAGAHPPVMARSAGIQDMESGDPPSSELEPAASDNNGAVHVRGIDVRPVDAAAFTSLTAADGSARGTTSSSAPTAQFSSIHLSSARASSHTARREYDRAAYSSHEETKTDRNRADHDAVAVPAPVASKELVTVIDPVITGALAASVHGAGVQLDASLPLLFAFVEAAVNGQLPPPLVEEVLIALASSAHAFAPAMTNSPRAFYYLVAAVEPLLDAPPFNSATFVYAVDFLFALGCAACQRADDSSESAEEAAVGSAMFRDFLLPQIVELIRRHPAKRPGLLRVCLGFCRRAPAASGGGIIPAARLALIRNLQQILSDTNLLVACVAASLHVDANLLDQQLAELHAYYALIGMGAADPSLRAAAVGVLTALAPSFPQAAIGLLPRVAELAGVQPPSHTSTTGRAIARPTLQDDSPEVLTAVAVAAATLLDLVPALRLSESMETQMLHQQQQETEAEGKDGMESTPAADVAEAGCVAVLDALSFDTNVGGVVAQLLACRMNGRSDLIVAFTRAAIQARASERESFLAHDAGAPENPISQRLARLGGAGLAVPAVRPFAPSTAAAVLQAVSTMVTAEELQNLEVAHFQVVVAALEDASTAGDWIAAAAKEVQTFLDHIFVECCTLAVQTLQLLLRPQSMDVARHILAAPTLQGSLLLLHEPPAGQSPDQALQAHVQALFKAVSTASPELGRAVRDCLSTFEQRHPRVFRASSLRELVV